MSKKLRVFEVFTPASEDCAIEAHDAASVCNYIRSGLSLTQCHIPEQRSPSKKLYSILEDHV